MVGPYQTLSTFHLTNVMVQIIGLKMQNNCYIYIQFKTKTDTMTTNYFRLRNIPCCFGNIISYNEEKSNNSNGDREVGPKRSSACVLKAYVNN